MARPKKFCTIDGCDRVHCARGLCRNHYQQAKARGEFGHDACSVPSCYLPGTIRGLCRNHYQLEARRDERRRMRCNVDGCERAMIVNGMCHLHNARVARFGEPGPAGLMRAPNGSGHISSGGYHMTKVDGRNVPTHRIVMEEVLGRPLSDRENVHHVNGVRDDNRPENLELWVKPQPSGQRVADLVEWVISEYPEYVRAALEANPQLQMLIEQT